MTKSTISLFIALCITVVLNAQTIPTTPNDSVSVTATQTDEFEPTDAHIEVINSGNTSTTFTWMLKDYTAPSVWELKLCDNNNCYDLLLNPGPYESLTVLAGDTMDMKFQFSAHCTAGIGNANVIIYVTGDSANTATMLNYKANLAVNCPNGVSELTAPAFKVTPNPFQSSFSIAGFSSTQDFRFEVYDLTGRLVESETSMDNNSVEVKMPSAPAGSYILRAINSKGEVVSNSKVQKVN